MSRPTLVYAGRYYKKLRLTETLAWYDMQWLKLALTVFGFLKVSFRSNFV